MNFIKMVLSGLIEIFDASVGRGTGDFRKGLTGIIAFASIVAVFCLFVFLFDKTNLSGIKPIILSVLCTFLLLVIVGICAIIIEKIW